MLNVQRRPAIVGTEERGLSWDWNEVLLDPVFQEVAISANAEGLVEEDGALVQKAR